MKHVEKTDSKEVIYDAYLKVLNYLRVQKHKNKQHVLHKREIIKKKNKQYNTLHYKYFRMTQVLYGVNKKIDGLKGASMKQKSIGRKIGYKEGVSKFDKNTFSTDNAARFIGMCDFMAKVLGYKMDECAFLVWANKYDFFTKQDFIRDMGDTGVQYYYNLSKFTKRKMLNKLDIKREKGRYKFSLNAIGKLEAGKLDKFIKRIK
jgi:hypothetical protein